jgi:hypothetical protein
MEAERNPLLPESHCPGFQDQRPLNRSMPKTRLALFLEPISNQPRLHLQPRRVSFVLLPRAQLIYQARPRPNRSSLSYLPMVKSPSRKSVPTVITRPCLSGLPRPKRMFSYLLDERGQRRCRCTISPTDSLGNQSLSSPRSISSGQLRSSWYG